MMRWLLPVVCALALAACDADPIAQADSGVRGVVRLGPQCPVEIAGSPCPEVPFEGDVQALTQAGEVVAEVPTDGQGRFELALEPGSYTLQAVVEAGSFPSAVPVPVQVQEGAFVRVTLEVDTGIR